jgi:hypothetical protein
MKKILLSSSSTIIATIINHYCYYQPSSTIIATINHHCYHQPSLLPSSTVIATIIINNHCYHQPSLLSIINPCFHNQHYRHQHFDITVYKNYLDYL